MISTIAPLNTNLEGTVHKKYGNSEKGTSVTYFSPILDPLLGGFSPKVNSNVRGHEYFIPTKIGLL